MTSNRFHQGKALHGKSSMSQLMKLCSGLLNPSTLGSKPVSVLNSMKRRSILSYNPLLRKTDIISLYNEIEVYTSNHSEVPQKHLDDEMAFVFGYKRGVAH